MVKNSSKNKSAYLKKKRRWNRLCPECGGEMKLDKLGVKTKIYTHKCTKCLHAE